MRIVRIHPNGRSVTYEMYVMPARSQFGAKLGGDDP